MRANGGWCNWKMIEIEKFQCVDGNEARKREQDFIDLQQENLNSYRAFNSEEDNIERSKQYRENNKEMLKEKATLYQQEHKDQHNKSQKQ